MDRCSEIISKYPAVVGLEQLRIICRISKRKASYILANGYIPSVNSGKETRQYKIKTKDIVGFLVEIEEHPEKFPFPSFSSIKRNISNVSEALPIDKEFNDLLENYYLNLLNEYPDLLTTAHISDLLGYSKDTVRKWIHDERFLSLRRGSLIPKKSFVPFLTGQELNGKRVKSKKHQELINQILQIYNA